MLMSPGDIADRYTILRLKAWHSQAPDSTLAAELHAYAKELPDGQLDAIYELLSTNRQIWQLESQIRSGKEGQLTLDEIGKRALAIRDWNNRRVAIKNQINRVLKWPFTEKKIDHASAA